MEFHTGGKARELFRMSYPEAADSVRYKINSEADSYIPEPMIFPVITVWMKEAENI